MRIQFPAYRRYKRRLVAVNDAMMALMIGARLGEHQLANSPASPDARLPELYGGIAGINRVNRTVGEAADLLSNAENHLSSMGIPYVLSAHAGLLSEAILLLRKDGLDDAATTGQTHAWIADPKQIALSAIHEYFVERAGQALDGVLLEPSPRHTAPQKRARVVGPLSPPNLSLH